MQIKIHTQHLNLSPDQESAISAKVGKLADYADRVSDDSSEIKVDLSHEQSKRKEDAYSCHLTVFVPHDTLRAEARAETLENVVDDVMEKMKPQIEHYKSKTHHMGERK